LVQSDAIVRYLARTHNLSGSTPAEAAVLDQFSEGLNDFVTGCRNALPKGVDAVKEVIHKWFGFFERALKSNQNGTGYFGSALSYVDLRMWYMIDNFVIEQKIFDYEKDFPYPLLKALKARVEVRAMLVSSRCACRLVSLSVLCGSLNL
jgi:glutathione S-transferase